MPGLKMYTPPTFQVSRTPQDDHPSGHGTDGKFLALASPLSMAFSCEFFTGSCSVSSSLGRLEILGQSHMRLSIVMGVPPNGWFILLEGHIPEKMDDSG